MIDNILTEKLTRICKHADELDEEGSDYILTHNNKEVLREVAVYIKSLHALCERMYTALGEKKC